MTKTMYIKVGDQFKNEFDNTCTIERISEPLVICSEEICQTGEDGYTETVGAKEVTYTMNEMKHMLRCKYLRVADECEDSEEDE